MQPSLLDTLSPSFEGAHYSREHDQDRLISQRDVIRDLMQDGKARTVRQIAAVTGYPETSISAQLRNLRKPKHGGYDIRSERVGDPQRGLFVYRLIAS